ncbi:MAG: TIR protein [Candidatus Magnetoglobus multicellularis str. Araruama]|uniref:TIR protein n=1 Tax=Candidatus Magnetoglobus multicellularis str. Araruama TaxID=890399 RepID=A0A1V1NYU0_9BACT|nr:MAG: TIR protein [Candidatus Magnetoglobus multicellularis str. Araruama]
MTASKNAIFISYAHVDDKGFGDNDKGWVTTLVDALQTKLAEYLGREEYFDLWQDKNKLHGNDLIQDTIMNTLDHTDILLIILSPAYINSEWCRLELNRFVEKMQSHKEITRVFVVEKNKTTPPDCLNGLLNYRFWEQKDAAKAPTVYGELKQHDKFYEMVNDIAYEMSQKLDLIKQMSPVQPQVLDNRPQIYLARPAEDSFAPYDDVKRFLDSEGYRVVPETHIGLMDPSQYQKDVKKLMASCKAYVQLVGCSPGKQDPELPGICVLQHKCACEFDMPRLVWRSDIDINQIADPQHKEMVAHESEFINLEQFKQNILHKLKPKEEPVFNESFVLLNAHEQDLKLSDDIGNFLHHHNIQYMTPLSSASDKRYYQNLLFKLKSCDAVIVVYGHSDITWTEEKLLFCYKHCCARKTKVYAFAVYQGPPKEKPRLGIHLKDMVFIHCPDYLDETQFAPFLTALQKGGAV